MKKFFKVMLYIFLGFIGLIVITSIFTDSDSIEKPKSIEEALTTDAERDVYEALQNMEKEIPKKFTEGSYTHHEGLIAIVSHFDKRKNDLKMYHFHPNKAISEYANKVKSKQADRQGREYPKLREAFADIMGEALWVHDVKVKLSGRGGRNITLTSYNFFTNQSRLEVFESIKNSLHILRFQKLTMKSSDKDNNPTEFEINSPKDDFVF